MNEKQLKLFFEIAEIIKKEKLNESEKGELISLYNTLIGNESYRIKKSLEDVLKIKFPEEEIFVRKFSYDSIESTLLRIRILVAEIEKNKEKLNKKENNDERPV